ncbi:hypothetical protein F5B22DRAFT_649934 [Xylaria bambusicola]|uniref:uncharacterized protein n=1 Tax=Xylaria bambusicola TaxID=326684 RepID=UPI0020078446|nr:uncharacterized protein F5B22DRAFT_649934 [Xylaria bambusicola]KAI0508440.1 hypothetical protein F5B22DRAFT_649934 [Xylaria bambusicola]
MRLTYIPLLVGINSVYAVAEDSKAHGEGTEGTVQGPVAFLWPEDRPWSSSTDNSGPCGSPNGVINRTSFPLSQGSIALTIADEAWNVAFSVAYDNDPTVQTQFIQQVANVAVVESGHQCYKINDIPDTVVAGSNATIQMKYWSSIDNELGGRNQTFFACADITFVEAADFSTQVPCFNVTSSDFNLPESSSTATAGQPENTANTSSDSNSGLTKGAIAGVAVGVVVASLLIIGVVAFFVLRGRKSQALGNETQQDGRKVMTEVASVNSRQH